MSSTAQSVPRANRMGKFSGGKVSSRRIPRRGRHQEYSLPVVLGIELGPRALLALMRENFGKGTL